MSNGDPRHLRPVEEVAEAEAPAVTSDGGSAPQRPWLLAALCAALLIVGGGWIWQAREAAGLEARLSATRAALARSEQRVEALEGHLGSVRDRFATLQTTLESELDALGGLLATEPGTAPPADR